MDQEYNLAVRKWKTELCYWTFDDFCHHYDYIQPNPVFVPMTTYLSVTERMEMIEKILEIQTDGNVQQFVKEVYAVSNGENLAKEKLHLCNFCSQFRKELCI